MNIKVKLEDTRFCNGCPCRNSWADCRLYKHPLAEPIWIKEHPYIPRPPLCAKENGK